MSFEGERFTTNSRTIKDLKNTLNSFSKTTAGAETWLYGYDSETKEKCSQSSPCPEKDKTISLKYDHAKSPLHRHPTAFAEK